MSLNRYIFVCHNILYKKIFSRPNSIMICIGVYCVGIGLVVMNFAGIGGHSFDKKSLECIWDRMADYPYTVVYSVTLVWIPCIVIGICYLRLYCFVNENKKKLLHHKIRSFATSPVSIVAPKSNLKLAKTFILIYVVFVTCWAPYAILIVIDYKDVMTHEIHVYITVWAHLHPSVNWLIYYLTQRKLAEAYRQILVCTITIKKPNRLNADSSVEVDKERNGFQNGNFCQLSKIGLEVDDVCSKTPNESIDDPDVQRLKTTCFNAGNIFRHSVSDGNIKRYFQISIREKTSQSTVNVDDWMRKVKVSNNDPQEVKILMEIYKTIRGIQTVVTSYPKCHIIHDGSDLKESSSMALL